MDMEPLFHGWEPLLRIVLVGLISYMWLLLLLRASGKRALSRLSAFDFIISMAVGSILAKVMLTPELSLSESLVAIAMLIALQHCASWLTYHVTFVRHVLEAKPTVLFHRGQLQRDAMRRERITESEIIGELHGKGFQTFAEIDAIILGANGQLAFLPKLPPSDCTMDGNV